MFGRKLQIPLALSALIAVGALYTPLASQADNLLVKETRSIHLCGDLFEIEANADKMTAAERARIIQKNLDDALIKALDRSPDSVAVRVKNKQPVVELNGYHIATADTNSAIRKGVSQMELATEWAQSIRECLADQTSVERYVSALQGPAKVSTGLVKTHKHIAVVPPETRMPIKLLSAFHFDGTTVGDSVTAVISRDVPLGPQFDTYLPAGTMAHGNVLDAEEFTYNGFPGGSTVTIQFTKLETPDGQQIPIQAFVVGGVNEFEIAAKEQVDPQGALDLTTGATSTKGLISGAWVGNQYAKDEQSRLPRLFMSRGAVFDIGPMEELQLETTATTSIAIAEPVGTI
ncbi:TrbI/VirB10 family protein [Candidatus Obscuribacterales bacterium]|nr:TrbI/VirB10 family protein [Candidatus Obscuribacterales bacterium]